MNANLTNIRHRWDKAKLTKKAAFWVAIGAIILTLFFGFTRGGWVTGGSARQMAATTSNDAVVARLTPICLAQFNQDPLKDQKLEELQALNISSQRTTYVKAQGWATMPGEAQPDNKVAAACTQQLMLMGK